MDGERAPQALRDVRLGTAVTGVRLLPGGVGVEVEVAGQVRVYCHSEYPIAVQNTRFYCHSNYLLLPYTVRDVR